jgi:anti-anti-sigma factor
MEDVMNKRIDIENGVATITLEGDFTADTAGDLKAVFTNWYSPLYGKNVVVDMDGVPFMDSTGLGTLMTMLKKVSERGGDIYLCNLKPAPALVIEVTRAYLLLHVCDSRAEALRVAS